AKLVSPKIWRNHRFRVPNSLKIQSLRQKKVPPRGWRNLRWRNTHRKKLMRICVLGFTGKLPLAGVTAHFLQYVLGLRKLGHDVFYIDDGGAAPFDPTHNVKSGDFSYSINYLRRHLGAFGLGERWAYMDYRKNYYGMSKQQTLEVLRTSDLLIN